MGEASMTAVAVKRGDRRDDVPIGGGRHGQVVEPSAVETAYAMNHSNAERAASQASATAMRSPSSRDKASMAKRWG
jgi:hypothetical protein